MEQIKKVVETASGVVRPRQDQLPALISPRTPRLYRFDDDGMTPNNAKFPLIIYEMP